MSKRKNKDTPLNVIDRFIRTELMSIAQGMQYDNRLDLSIEGSDVVNNKHRYVGEASYLYNKNDFHNAYINSGYIKGVDEDYGLVSKAVGNRKLPIYQKNIDDIDRNKLTVLGNTKNDYMHQDKRLVDAGEYPTALYIDDIGNVYQKSWDLNDYGNDETGASGERNYTKFRKKVANYLDKIGNPHVVTSGFVKLDPEGIMHFLDNNNEDIQIKQKILNYQQNKDILNEYVKKYKETWGENFEHVHKSLNDLYNTNKNKFGGMTKRKRIVPNVIRGGVAIPLGANYFYMKGNKHEAGGIDIGKDLEVEGGEIIKMDNKQMKILSDAPIMYGVSPAQMALGGLKDGTFEQRFNKGFAYQEKFKDVNGLKDDGTKAVFGKIKRWLNKDSEIDASQKGGYAKSSEKDRFDKSKELDPTGGFGPSSFVIKSASGEEQQYYREYLGLPSRVPKMNPKAKTEWDDKVEAEKVKNGELPSDFYGTTKRMDLNLQAIGDTLNTGKIYRNYDEYKKANPKLPSKKTIKTIYETGKRVLNSPNEWHQVDGDITAIKKGLEISTQESNPLGMLADFGMKWVPEENKIYIHDTYDFPEILTGKGRPMYDRPKEMKIRGRIDFNPKKGSYLLRDNMANYNDYPEPLYVDRNSLELKYKLGGKTDMKINKRNVPSTGERTKANMGIVTNPAFKKLYRKVTGSKLTLDEMKTPKDPNAISFLDANPNFLGNAITAGANIIGSTISYFNNRKMLKDLEEPARPEYLQSTKLKTNVNIKPQINQLRRTVDKYNRFVNRNTASSQVAAGRHRLNELSYFDNYNQLYGAKENQETQLINKDRLNQQEVAKYNLEKHNDWVNRTTNFRNNVRELQSENNVAYVQGLTGSLGNFLNNNAQWNQSMANIAALSAAYPDVTPELMNSKGLPYALWLKQRNARRAAKKIMG